MRVDATMLLLPAISLAAGAAMGGGCAWISGASVLSFIGPLAIVPAIVPQAMGRERRLAVGVVATLVLSLAAGLGWWMGLMAIGEPVAAGLVVRATLVLAGWSLLLFGVTSLLVWRPGRRRGVLRGAGVTIVAWLWLTWPVWLGPALAARGQAVPLWISGIHPLLAMNRAVTELGIWTQQPIAYQLTPLGQDVLYALPATIWPFVLLHLLLATLATAGAAIIRRRRRPASTR